MVCCGGSPDSATTPKAKAKAKAKAEAGSKNGAPSSIETVNVKPAEAKGGT
jgi:hypothetical protein